MRSDEVGGGQEAAKALESIGLASSIRRHGYRYRGYFCHPCIRGYWIQWIQLYRGYHSMCILAKRWYPRLYPWIRLYSCHSRRVLVAGQRSQTSIGDPVRWTPPSFSDAKLTESKFVKFGRILLLTGTRN